MSEPHNKRSWRVVCCPEGHIHVVFPSWRNGTLTMTELLLTPEEALEFSRKLARTAANVEDSVRAAKVAALANMESEGSA